MCVPACGFTLSVDLLKGSSDAKFTLLFEHKCVLEVCVHIHPIIKNPPSVFLNPYFKIPFLKSGWSEIPVEWLLHRPPHKLIDKIVLP